MALNDQTPNSLQQEGAAVNAQLGAKYFFLGVILMKLSNWHTFKKTSALLDCGSDTSLLRKDLLQRLNLK